MIYKFIKLDKILTFFVENPNYLQKLCENKFHMFV